ncbi:uncharacterized protein N7487_003204 [Penicillium crustosum]|uniref:uncharacterized protein n=1 Tax=Penicillium crustosum TaxID=36656 RepID=UPI0023A5C227|nr:uncharacterized protein N7487_003204 [Penicillium crustosum]KAJ5419654.1 hypothetical protein N7487_003204 [Penicillium crustosum]
MSDVVGESHRFPPIDGLHDRCCNISNERCRTAPLEFIKSPSPRCLSAKPASAFPSELSLHTYVLELLICKDVIPRELLVRHTDQGLYRDILTYTNLIYTSSFDRHSSPPSHRLFPHSSPDFVFCISERTTGIKPSSISTGINQDQTGIECLIRAWSFPCSFLVYFVFSSNFLSLGALCLAIAIVPRLVRGDLHSPPSPPRLSTHPGFKDRGNFPGLLARLTISPDFIPPILIVSECRPSRTV